MFEKMRRFRQELSKEDCERLLTKNGTGILSLIKADGYPYGVPINYIYCNGKIYFHCAPAGAKIDAIANSANACFTVIDTDEFFPEELTTHYKSVIAFGKVEIIEDEEERHSAIVKFCQVFDCPAETSEREIEKYKNSLCMLKFTPEHISGKQAKEFLT